MTLDNYHVGDVVAVQWNPELQRRFPNTEHNTCLQSWRYDATLGCHEPFDPPLCHGWHCPNCGAATSMYGHTQC